MLRKSAVSFLLHSLAEKGSDDLASCVKKLIILLLHELTDLCLH